MSNSPAAVRTSVCRLTALFVILLVFTPSAFTQHNVLGNELTHPVPGDGHEYITHLSEVVNPATGNLTVTIPLPMAKSRGYTLPLSLVYDSGKTHRTTTIYTGHTELGYGVTWDITAPYLAYDQWDQPYQANFNDDNCHFTGNYSFKDAHGSTHALNLAGASPVPFGDGSNPCTSYQGKTPPGPSWDIETQNSNPISVQTYVYFTNSVDPGFDPHVSAQMLENCDGSNWSQYCTTLRPHVDVQDHYGNTYHFSSLYTGCDGTGIVGSGGTSCQGTVLPDTIVDRNGNITRFSRDSNGSVRITDSSGRPALIGPNASSPNSLTVSGLAYAFQTTAGTTRTPFAEPTNPILNPSNYRCELSLSGNVLSPSATTLGLPNGTGYTFTYDPNYGVISEIKYPSGAWAKYEWQMSSTFNDTIITDAGNDGGGEPLTDGCKWQYKTPVIYRRSVGVGDDTTPPQLVQTFSYSTAWDANQLWSWTSKTTTVTTEDKVTNHSYQTVYTYHPVGAPSVPNQHAHIGNQIPTEVSIQTSKLDDYATVQETKTQIWQNYDFPKDITDTMTDGSVQTSKRVYELRDDDMVSEQDEYAADTQTLLRKTVNVWNAGVQCSSTVTDGAATPNKISGWVGYYDVGISPCNPVGSAYTQAVTGLDATTRDSSYSATSTTFRGNITKKEEWNGSDPAIVSTYSYDETGQLISATDGCGNTTCADMVSGGSHTTTFTYADAYDDATPAYNTNTYVRSVTQPLIGTSWRTYRYADGLLSSATDVNGQTTSYEYNDSLHRPTKITGPAVAEGHSLAIFCYDDSAPSPSVSKLAIQVSSATPSCSTVQASPSIVGTKTLFDGFGRKTQTQSLDLSGTVFVDTEYDGQGRAYKIYNPYRTNDTKAYATTEVDSIGRPTKQTNQDGGFKTWTYSGLNTTETNEVTNSWTRTNDILGRLTDVTEPGGVLTHYTYDLRNNLTGVTQDVNGSMPLTRSFTYDNLSRLLTSTNPETGTICYGTTGSSLPTSGNCTAGYDANDNLGVKTDARGVQTSYIYDTLDRLTGKTYSGVNSDASAIAANTEPVGFAYDGCSGCSIPNAMGRMIYEYTGTPRLRTTSRSIVSYDALGRVREEKQCATGSQCGGTGLFDLQYAYDLMGNLTYSNNGVSTNGIGFTYAYDQANRLTNVTSTWDDVAHPATLFAPPTSGAQYSAVGLVAAQFGVPMSSQQGVLSMSRQYDNRMRLISETDAGKLVTSPGVKSTGSIVLSGSEQSSGTSGNGYILFQTPSLTCHGHLSCTVDGDPGTLTVTLTDQASGHTSTASASYVDDGDDMETFLDDLADQLNAPDPASGPPLVSANVASCNDPGMGSFGQGCWLLNFTAVATGSSSNYPLSVTPSTGDDSIYSASGSTLTGGSTTGYDTGSVNVGVGVGGCVTVNNNPCVTATATWTSGSTLQSIASQISSQLQSQGIDVTSSTSNQSLTLNLASPAAGTAGNGAVTCSAADTAGQTASFSLLCSGMNGGVDPVTSNATLYAFSIPSGGYDAAGRLLHVDDSVMGSWAYTYDNLDRLTTAQAGAPGLSYDPYGSAHLLWSYDQFGNNKGQTLTGSTTATVTQAAYTFTGHNFQNGVQLTGPNNNRVDGYNYDAAGNLLSDGATNYTYDAENRIVFANSEQYIYDAEGHRVAKQVVARGAAPIIQSTYVLGLGAEQLSELDGQEHWVRTNVYSGGKELAEYDNTGLHFQFTDWIGSRRAQANGEGTSEETCRSLPFGDSLVCFDVNENLIDIGHSPDANNHHFTGKERDPESGLDYFGARYYASTMGRFVSPDPLMASGQAADPQTWNRYSYAVNSPAQIIDPKGLEASHPCAIDKRCHIIIKINVVYDATLHHGRGMTDKEKRKFEQEQLDKAQEDYSNSNIDLQFTYTPGAYTASDLTGLRDDSINLMVSNTTPKLGKNGTSGKTKKGYYVSFIDYTSANVWNTIFGSNTTEHELAHQILGDPDRGDAGGGENILRDMYIDSKNTVQGWGMSQQTYRDQLEHRRFAVDGNSKGKEPSK